MELIRNEKVAENTVELEFKVNAEQFADAVTKAFRKANKDITIPGFRKGKRNIWCRIRTRSETIRRVLT